MPGKRNRKRLLATENAATLRRSHGEEYPWPAVILIPLAAVAAYGNSLFVPFVLDDVSSIAGNPSLRHLWPLSRLLSPPTGLGLTVEGRPVLNVSLALNYAISGLEPWSYHALNLLIHILAGLTLYGVTRRTLAGIPAMASEARFVALASAVLWTVHPLQTESVTYSVQRTESLMGLFYLLTLYSFIRYAKWDSAFAKIADGNETERQKWAWGAVLACLFGMATKEVMVSAPLMIFLYDRTVVSGTFREAWRRHWRIYAGLGSTWILLGWLVFRSGSRGGTSGFGVGVSAPAYWLTQFPALARYLRLAVWPNPLVFDYGTDWVRATAKIIPAALAVTAIAAGATWCFLRRAPSGVRAAGFAGVCFFAILAPTSLVPGNRQTLAEHRMYLALAPVIVVGIATAVWVARRNAGASFPAWRMTLGGLIGVIGLLFCGLTARRNLDYRSELALYADTAAKRPGNAYTQVNFGTALLANGRPAAAVSRFEEALRLQPNYAIAENDLANALLELDRTAAAADHYRTALRLNPGFADAHNNLGSALMRLGRPTEALAEFETALRLQPDDAEAHNNLGSVLAGAGHLPEAIAHFQAALRLDPNYVAAHGNLARALRQLRPAPGSETP
jgi:protein O-mannosyl-transferase